MEDGFLKVAVVTPKLKVADVEYNCKEIEGWIQRAEEKKAKVVVFPELCITGYSCQDLFLQDALLQEARRGLLTIKDHSCKSEAVIFVGLPLMVEGKLYNVAAVLCKGRILGLVPKIYLPNYNEFYEARHFASGRNLETSVDMSGECVPVGSRILFRCKEMPALCIGVELCEDLWVPDPPGTGHCMAGATMMVNLSASDEMVGKSRYRRELVRARSAATVCAYLYTSAGPEESTQDVVYSAHNMIAENGNILAESELFTENMQITEVDLSYIEAERRRMTTYETKGAGEYRRVEFSLKKERTALSRRVDPYPFVPADRKVREERCREILAIQAMGLKKRLAHIGTKKAVIGISGGLDSTLALLVCVKAFDLLGLDRKGIVAVTMPGFGTTDRTYENALQLIKETGAELREVKIGKAVEQHFADIGHDSNVRDVTYENSQARERTQILMDMANQENGIVIGTGDLSELALGWATYNGDHMSMYAVNVSVPKTLVRYLVRFYADTTEKEGLRRTLYDVLDTPVSPELLPPEEGQISQKTEDLVGPYELHDFFLYHMLRLCQSPGKIFRLAGQAFEGSYAEAEILRWEKVFYQRFFSQQFKRSCLPDGPKVGSVAVSPRGDLRMPSDASAALWLKELERFSESKK